MSPTSPRQPGAGAGGARHQQGAASPAPFKVHRDLHLIHKQGAGASSSSPPSSSSTNSSISSSPGAATAATNNNGGPGGQQRPAPRPKQQQPVIIYTHSPKVIRTSPRDFMSIVQKLTGLESAAAAQDESSSSSTESCANANAHAHAAAPPGHFMDPQLVMPPPAPLVDAHFMPDIPLFAPGASEQQLLLCTSRGLYGQFPPTTVDTAALGPVNMHGAAAGAMFSPSMVEAMRTTFPDYQLT